MSAEPAAKVVADADYASRPVPREAQRHWFSVAVTKFGQVSALSQFLIGSTLGFGMTFFHAFLAITMGSVILQIVSILVGIIGQRQGLTTSLLTRWTGFGRGGAAVVGAVIAISSIGWFGIQSAVSAQGLHSTVGVMPEWLWALLFGLAITVVVIVGFSMIARVAYIAVPAFLLLVIWSVAVELTRHDIGDLLTSPPPGPEISLLAGTGIVAGGFIVGAVINSDITRYNRSPGDVVKQTIVGISGGEYLIGLIGVLLAHAVHTDDVIAIILSSVGWVGVLVIILGTVKINDINLYSSVFGIVNLLNTLFKRPVDRKVVAISVGIAGSILGAVGILDHFTAFLTFLGVLMPPVAAVMIAEYFVVKTWRGELEAARAENTIPETEPVWVPTTLVVWAIGSAVGYFIPWGIPAINSLIVAFVLYVLAGRMSLVRETGRGTCPERAAISQPASAMD
ncbi:purine-cytosine permease family protein [Ornithinimicrobium cavernae]|uniref:purine-cytosine permease family protein n=1 Tax=Ornithinimicrobium cavernae TaxID=2666047 RepID=UPI000D689F28|nr:cytosine permease [Ornithinimicrobium cavernae]